MDRGAWRATVHRATEESDTTKATKHACTQDNKPKHRPTGEKQMSFRNIASQPCLPLGV